MAQEVNGSKRPKQVKNPSPHRVLERHTRGGTGAYVCVCVFHAPFSGVRIGARPSDGIHLVLTFEKLSLWPQLPVAPMGKKCNS